SMTDFKEIKQVPLTVEPEYVLDINSLLQAARGQTIEEIASENPREAYRIIRIAMLSMMGDVDRAVGPDGQVIATSKEDGLETPRNVGRQVLQEMLPEILTEPLRIELSMWEAPDGFT